MMNDLKKKVLQVSIQKLIISKHPHNSISFINTFFIVFLYLSFPIIIILYDLLYLDPNLLQQAFPCPFSVFFYKKIELFLFYSFFFSMFLGLERQDMAKENPG